ncbi:hypothetical protein JMJ77_0011401 [Colletotrichum scovillei]|uniref:Uncharacterized protein n=1 Tax=Colletotrichum scovillei TaxID=1209932 RepID=A0A9P7QS97_9PEZI|nr:hypothetical protein JMJ78_0008091 [Colletotrichum scovillei]KAG7040537.1 hypothetical protein JMJ77_0011401 [Colletotrichum scovillei]KAG7060586.1 hypothetical protein JMJ76_0012158 [Colletotrichum scovillei]
MAQTSQRRKRQAEEDEEEYQETPFKRSRVEDVSYFQWLWTPPRPPSRKTSSSGLWSHSVPDGLFLTRHDAPRSFSLPPESTSRRPRRRGAISVTSSSPSEMDRHLARQLQHQIAILRRKAAEGQHQAQDEDCCEDDGDDDDNVHNERDVDRLQRELEAVQIDAPLPSILGIAIDFDQKLCLSSSGRSSDATSGHRELHRNRFARGRGCRNLLILSIILLSHVLPALGIE